MGLDMYLRAKKYVSEYTNKEIFEKLNELDVGQNGMSINEISAEAMYWRKSNAIHAWFVRECQNGVDNCQEYWVSEEKLKQLRDICREVLMFRKKADELLPTQGGFFFGQLDYDSYYFDDIERTESRLTAILENEELMKDWNFYYQSSW